MGITTFGEPYDPKKAKTSVLQPKIYPLPVLHRPWFKNRIVCEEGWSISFSGSSWRTDKYDYYEGERHLVLGGEGAAVMEIFIPKGMVWDDPPDVALDDQTRARVLHNITAALQWAGFSVAFFLPD